MKFLEPGVKMGVCLFLGQAASFKVLDELRKNELLETGWHLVLSTAVLIVGWQTVQYAYSRGLKDAQDGDVSLSQTNLNGG